MFMHTQPQVPGLAGDPATAVMLQATLGKSLRSYSPMGSRVTCDPPPADTDEDWLVLTKADPADDLRAVGFVQDGASEFYTGNEEGGFRSWRRGDLNVVTTQDAHFFDLFMTATFLAKRFNLLRKADRIALFQGVLYGNRWTNPA